MKKVGSATALVVGLLLLGIPTAIAQPGSVSGRVVDGDSGRPLALANVVIETLDGRRASGTASDRDGYFSIASVEPGMYTLVVRYVGFDEARTRLEVAGGAAVTVEVGLTSNEFAMEAVTVTGGRVPEKVIEVPASLSLVAGESLMRNASMGVPDVLRAEPGVHVADTGLDVRTITLRGFASAFNNNVRSLTDYRNSGLAHWSLPIFSNGHRLDIERIEIIRGPAGALYGPGAEAGVVHTFTRSPFADPGTSFFIGGGERSALEAGLRVAGSRGRVGYKLNLSHLKADDWEWDPDDPDDQLAVAHDLAPRAYDRQHTRSAASLYYQGRALLTLTAGTEYSRHNQLNTIGPSRMQGWWNSFVHLRASTSRIFGQVYLNAADSGDSFVYTADSDGDGVPNPFYDHSLHWVAQVQGRVLDASRIRVVTGLDADWVSPRTGGTVHGRKEDEDNYQLYGAYAHATVQPAEAIELSGVLRSDYSSVEQSVQWSPRVAAVYRPGDRHAIRMLASRAYAPPGAGVGDMLIRQTGGIDMRWSESRGGYSWLRNPAFRDFAESDLVAFSLNPASPGSAMPLGISMEAAYAAVYGTMGGAGALRGALAARGVALDEAEAASLWSLLAPGSVSPVGFSDGSMARINLTTGALEPISQLTDLPVSRPRITNSLEVGYRGQVSSRATVSADLWWMRQDNLAGMIVLQTPFVFLPTLQGDLAAALTESIADHPQLAASGVAPEVLAEVLAGTPGTGLDGPVAIVVPDGEQPAPGELPALLMMGRSHGSASYWGMDLAVRVQAHSRLTFWGNLGWISQNEFDHQDLGESDPNLFVSGNIPRIKGNVGVDADWREWRASLGARARDGFRIYAGTSVGEVEGSILVDLSVAHHLDRVTGGLSVQLGVTNLLNDRHREYVGVPRLGRLAMLRLVYDP